MDHVTLKITKERAEARSRCSSSTCRAGSTRKSEEQYWVRQGRNYDRGARYLLLDLAEVDTLTSAGMRAMQKVYKTVHTVR